MPMHWCLRRRHRQSLKYLATALFGQNRKKQLSDLESSIQGILETFIKNVAQFDEIYILGFYHFIIKAKAFLLAILRSLVSCFPRKNAQFLAKNAVLLAKHLECSTMVKLMMLALRRWEWVIAGIDRRLRENKSN